MDRSHRSKLLREAVDFPERLPVRKKFWRLELWPHYLRRCNELLFDDPRKALAFALQIPELAAKIAAGNPAENGADFMLLGYSYLGSAYRAVGDYVRAEDAFRKAQAYRDGASPEVLAEYLRRLAYLRLFQKDPECFPIISEAITICKRGNLVNRQALGECLVCRGHAFVMFDQHGKSFDDWTAALNHLSIRINDRQWYSAVHNLAVWAADFGTDEQLQTALDNLKPALVLLCTYSGRKFAKLKLRWLVAVIDARLGHSGSAELAFLDVRDGLVAMELVYEVGMVQIDLALLYLAQGRHAKLEPLARETAAIFRRIGVEAKAQEALDVWRQAEEVDEDLLKRVRGMFAAEAKPIPAIAA